MSVARSLSSMKRLRQNKRRAARNTAAKSLIKSRLRGAKDAIASNDAKSAQSTFVAAVQLLDRSAAKGVIHKNTAARRKSRLARRLNAVTAKKK